MVMAQRRLALPDPRSCANSKYHRIPKIQVIQQWQRILLTQPSFRWPKKLIWALI